MKKVELLSVTKELFPNDLYFITYAADGVVYIKHNVAISLYGYSFDVTEGVDDFNISLHVVKKPE